ncbi:hypothetical protein P4V47_22365 [Brevibacillus laterosporus]|uniref:hypothetical protein n=1 Tax=Brevibacillus laterosporus TaxID=1465 RepID=UPI002E1AE6C9|nr:hypothetical protein [Brevibacillus laterosporus]
MISNKIENRLNQITLNIIHVLKQQEYINGIALVGSINISDSFNDYDLLILHEHEEVFRKLKNIFSEYNISTIDDSIRITFEDNNKDINLALYTNKEFSNKVYCLFKENNPIGEHREWAIGYWLPEMLIQDLLKCTIIYDKENNFNDILNFISGREVDFRNMIIEKCKCEINTKINYLNSKISDLEIKIIRNDLLLTFIRLSSLLTCSDLTGFKKLDSKLNTYFYQMLSDFSKTENSRDTSIFANKILNHLVFGGKYEF